MGRGMRGGDDIPSPADLQPELDLWNAALSLLIEDGKGFVTRGAGTGGERLNAYRDLLGCGPMTCTLAHFCVLDPGEISEAFRRWVEANSSNGKPTSRSSQNGRRRSLQGDAERVSGRF